MNEVAESAEAVGAAPPAVTTATALPEDLRGTVRRVAGACGAWGPSLSPDAAQLAYVTDRSGLPRLEVADLRRDPQGGDDVAAAAWRTVSGADEEVVSVSWSPDGAWLAYLVAPQGLIRAELHLCRPDGSQRRRADAGDEMSTVFAGAWTRTPDGSVAYVSTLADGRGGGSRLQVTDPVAGTSRLLPGPGFQVVTSVSGAGGRAVVRRGRRGHRALWLVGTGPGEGAGTPAGGEGLRLLRASVPDPWQDRGEDGVVLPDGRCVLLRTDAVPGTGGRVVVARVDLDGAAPDGAGPAEVVAAREDADCEGVVLRPGGDALCRWNVGGRTELELRDLDAGAPARTGHRLALPPGAQVVHAWSLTADGSAAVLEASGPALPRSLWWLRLPATGTPVPVTQTTQLLGCCPPHDLPGHLVLPELQRYRGDGGLELEGWAYRPHGSTGPVPTVLFLHGGPEAQERPTFSRLAQALLAAGIAVFAPNVRGSDGYGAAFRALDDGPARWDSMRDVPATVEHVLASGLAAPGRVGVHGWSYGGYLTLASVCRWPSLFAAGSSLAGMSDLRTFFAGTETWMAAASTTEYGDPEHDAQMLAELSPMTYLDRVRLPLLLAHGDRDTNVPLGEALQAHELMTGAGGRSELLVLPGEGHAVVGRASMQHLAERLTAFYRSALGLGGTA